MTKTVLLFLIILIINYTIKFVDNGVSCNTSLASRRTFFIAIKHKPRRFDRYCFRNVLLLATGVLHYWLYLLLVYGKSQTADPSGRAV